MEKINGAQPNVRGRFQIRVSEIMELQRRFAEINDNEIMHVDFLDDKGFPIQIEQKHLDDWKFTGLNITDFIASGFYLKGFSRDDEGLESLR